MSKFRKQAHSIWNCTFHIVFVPKYRFRILKGQIKSEVEIMVRALSEQMDSEVIELNVREDHVHLVVMVPPKISIANYVGKLKGKIAIRLFGKFPKLRIKPYWGNHFWTRGYCVGTVGLDLEKIKKYVKYQDNQERELE